MNIPQCSKNIKLILMIFILGIFASSCREIIPETFADFNPLPVINAILIDGHNLSVNVSMSDTLDNSRLEYLDNAKIELFVNDVYAEDLIYSNNGEYKSKTVIKSANKYSCKVVVPGYDTIFCEQVIPPKPAIHDIVQINVAGKDQEGISYPAIELSFANKASIKSYYHVVIFFDDHGKRSEANLKSITDPVLLNEGIPYAIFSNDLIKDSVYKMHINYWTNVYTTSSEYGSRTELYPFYVELRQVSEDYYRYIKQLYLYKDGFYADGILTSMTNNNLFSNIQNGYGIFAAYSAVASDTITPNLDDYYGD